MAVFLSGFISTDVARHVEPYQTDEDAYVAAHPEATPGELQARQVAWLAEHPAPRTTIGMVADHIDHLRSVMGVDHVGIGSDFDGGELLPDDLEDVSGYPSPRGAAPARLIPTMTSGPSPAATSCEVMRGAEAVARELQATTEPSEATIEDSTRQTESPTAIATTPEPSADEPAPMPAT
jgi:membrane dipeptidase